MYDENCCDVVEWKGLEGSCDNLPLGLHMIPFDTVEWSNELINYTVISLAITLPHVC